MDDRELKYERNISESSLESVDYLDSGGQSRIFTCCYKGKKIILKKENVSEEIKFSRQLSEGSHPNIIRYIGEITKEVGILLEHTDGDLEHFITCDIKYNILREDPMGFIKQLLDGLGYLHSKDIIHLDIQPRNVLVKGKVLKFTDFNLAVCKTESHPFDPNSIQGRPGYVSPECFHLNKQPCEVSDTWPLGSVVWMLLTRTLAYVGDNKFSIYLSIGDYKHPECPYHWPVGIQKFFFGVWDQRILVEELHLIFYINKYLNDENGELSKTMPLITTRVMIDSNASRIVAPIIWNRRNKEDVFKNNEYITAQKYSITEMKNQFGHQISRRKYQNVQLPCQLFKYLNECGIIKTLEDFYDFGDLKKIKQVLAEACETTMWRKIVRSCDICDDVLNKLEKCEDIKRRVWEIIRLLDFQLTLKDLQKIIIEIDSRSNLLQLL